MTKWLSHRMVERGIIKEEEQELYQFGIRNGMILLLNVVTALVIGLLTEQLAVVAVFTLSFMVLRSYTGGYHSDSRIFCYLGSNLVLLVPVYTQAVFYKTGSINILAKKPDDWSKGMVLCITVEFYAILSLLASMLMIINISA